MSSWRDCWRQQQLHCHWWQGTTQPNSFSTSSNGYAHVTYPLLLYLNNCVIGMHLHSLMCYDSMISCGTVWIALQQTTRVEFLPFVTTRVDFFLIEQQVPCISGWLRSPAPYSEVNLPLGVA
jgi:hypothetical protein